MILYVILGVIVWLICGLIASGFIFAYFQREYHIIRKFHFKKDRCDTVVSILLGLFSLICVYVLNFNRKGWLWPWGKKAKEEAGLI